MTREEVREYMEHVNSDKEWVGLKIFFHLTTSDGKKSADCEWPMNVRYISKDEGKEWCTNTFIRALGRGYHAIAQVSNLKIEVDTEADTYEDLLNKQGTIWKSCKEIEEGDEIGFLHESSVPNYITAYGGKVTSIDLETKKIEVNFMRGWQSLRSTIDFKDVISMSGEGEDEYIYFKEGPGPDWQLIELGIESQR